MARDIEGLLRQQAALAAFGSFAFQETDLNKILTEAARVCADSLGVRHSKICRYRSGEDDLLVEAGFGWNEDIVGRVVSSANESSPQGRAFVTGEPVIVHDLQVANDYSPPDFYADHGIVSTVDVLIKAHNGLAFGVLEVDSRDAHSYDQHDIDFLTGFANVLAEAVATATRTEELRASNTNLTTALAEKDRLLAERDLLARELQHRVRNNLHLITAMLSDRLRNTPDRAGRSGLRGIMQRILGLREVYEHLNGAGMTDEVDFGVYGSALCENLPDLHPKPAFAVTLLCSSEVVMVSLSIATSLGMVVAELVSNAFEHAFHGRTGTIEVSIGHGEHSDEGIVTVTDDGIGYQPGQTSARHGVGLARELMEQIDGTLHISSGGAGTICTLIFPSLAGPPQPLPIAS